MDFFSATQLYIQRKYSEPCDRNIAGFTIFSLNIAVSQKKIHKRVSLPLSELLFKCAQGVYIFFSFLGAFKAKKVIRTNSRAFHRNEQLF